MVDDAEFYALQKAVDHLQKKVAKNHKVFVNAGRDFIHNDKYLLKRIEEVEATVKKTGGSKSNTTKK